MGTNLILIDSSGFRHLMYILDLFLENPPENHFWVIGGLLLKYQFIMLLYYYSKNMESF